jgi:hypothetical protein
VAERDELRKAAVDALYNARDSGKVMDVAAVLDALLEHPNAMLKELGGIPTKPESWARPDMAEWLFPEVI